MIAGIPDLRVYPDPYLDLEADRRKAAYLAEQARHRDVAGLVAHYYELTPEVPAELARRYAAHHLAGVARGHGLVQRLRGYGLSDALGPGRSVLDVGCGSGGFLAAAAASGAEMVGVDIALRWLVIGQTRLAEAGHGGVQLVCACADALPLPDARFTLVTAEGLLEHVATPDRVVAELTRVLAPSGAIVARTVNRLSLAPEPHVDVWGVGFLPRPLMNPYVRWRRGIPYGHIRLQSYRSLSRILATRGLGGVRVRAPLLTPLDYQHHPVGRQRLFALYARLCRLAPLRPLLTVFGPHLDVVGRPHPPASSGMSRLNTAAS